MDLPAADAVAPSDRGVGPRRPGRSYSQALKVGLAVSAVLHLIALGAYPVIMHVEHPAAVPLRVAPRASAPARGMLVVGIASEGGAAVIPGRPRDPAELLRLQGPAAPPGAPDLGESLGGPLIPPGPTAAERLRPRLQDARLWAPLSPDLNELTAEQRLELELAGRIVEWQDSLSAAAAAERALTDWTTTDAQGRKWGVSPGKIHLGDVTLPLPFMFGTPVGKRDEVNRRAWEWEEISRGAAKGEVRDSWKDRAQAIRERRDRERAKAPPDTTRVRR